MSGIFTQTQFDQLHAYATSGNLEGYYGLIRDSGDNYGTMALGVVRDDDLSGIVARDYAESVAAQAGVTNIDWNAVSLGLMRQDFVAREFLFSRNPSGSLILKN